MVSVHMGVEKIDLALKIVSSSLWNIQKFIGLSYSYFTSVEVDHIIIIQYVCLLNVIILTTSMAFKNTGCYKTNIF